ncbi:hypothetical protein ACFLTP_08060 [Chloroflexota bacterium]
MNTPNQEPTLKDIKESLKGQDRAVKKSVYRSYAAFGASITLVGVSLWIGSKFLSADTLFLQYIFLIVVGWGVIGWSEYKQQKAED